MTPPEPNEPADEPAARPQAAPPRRGCAGRLLGAAVVIAGLGVLGWYVYDRLLPAAGSGAVPLIEADDGPTKKRPEDPGGLVVPNQDKLVYETLDGEAAEETVERLLPAPEEPLPQPEPAEPVTEAPAPEPEPAAEQADIPPLPPAELEAETPTAAAEPAATPPPEPVAEAPESAAPEPEPAAPAETAAATPGVYLVQLASFREIAEADKAWRQLVKRHGDLLNEFTARVERADLGAELGIFYRLRVGPFGGEAAARALCDALKSRNLDCLVVRP